MRKLLASLAIVAALVTAVVVGMTVGAARQADTDAHADITAVSCSALAHHRVPAFTFTGACVTADGTLSTPDRASAIPRCKSDDFNDGSQALCWTERVTDGAYIVIDRTDRVVSVSAE